MFDFDFDFYVSDGFMFDPTSSDPPTIKLAERIEAVLLFDPLRFGTVQMSCLLLIHFQQLLERLSNLQATCHLLSSQ